MNNANSHSSNSNSNSSSESKRSGTNLRISPRGTAQPQSPPPPNKLPLPPRTAVAGFVSKLFRMVTEAPSNLIYWSPIGNSFVVAQPDEFARIVLPQFFKHNNFSSFVRQLNMYGFHKVPQPQQGCLASTHQEMESPTALVLWEFLNENFIRGRPELLPLVRRRVKEDEEAALGGSSLPSTPPATLQSLQQNILTMMQQQEAIKTDLEAVHRDSRLLWNESAASRERHQQQQHLIDRILQFLATVFANSSALNVAPRNELGSNPNSGSSSPINNGGKRQRLLLEDNPEFRKSVLDLINYSHNNSNATPVHSSPAIIPLDSSHLRDRVADLNETNNGITTDIRTLQEQLATFLDSNDASAYRSRSVSPQLSPFSGSSKKRSSLKMNADDILFDDLLKTSSVPPPEASAALITPTPQPPASSTVRGDDPLMGVAVTTLSDDFDINTYFATDEN